MAASSIDFDPTMKFSCSDTHPWPFALRRMLMKLSYCLFAKASFLSRQSVLTSEVCLNSRRNHVFFSLLCDMSSGRVLRKGVLAFNCLSRCGSGARVQALSSSGESVFSFLSLWLHPIVRLVCRCQPFGYLPRVSLWRALR